MTSEPTMPKYVHSKMPTSSPLTPEQTAFAKMLGEILAEQWIRLMPPKSAAAKSAARPPPRGRRRRFS